MSIEDSLTEATVNMLIIRIQLNRLLIKVERFEQNVLFVKNLLTI